MSADSMPTCGGKELMKIETSNAIGSRYRHTEVKKLALFDCKLKCLSMLGFFPVISCQNRYFFSKWIFIQKYGTPLWSSDPI